MDNNSNNEQMAFTRQNYIYLIIGIVVALLGYVLMSGGASDDPNVFSEEVFSFRRLTLAPVLIIAGLGFVFYAIMKKSK